MPEPATIPRAFRFDNIKAILIVLVVFGHTIPLGPSFHQRDTISNFFVALICLIYTFHMPAFVFVSGYFSSSKKHVINTALPLLGLYVVFQVIITIYKSAIYWEWPKIDELSCILHGPVAWYLLSLATWRLMVPILALLRAPAAVVFFACMFGMVAGHRDDLSETLSMSRTLGFFPFFAAGFFAREQHWSFYTDNQFNKTDWIFILGSLTFLPITLYIVYVKGENLLLFIASYSSIGVTFRAGCVFRLALYISAFSTIRWLLLLTPQSLFPWTSIGISSLGIYLGHIFVLIPVLRYVDARYFCLLSPILTVFCILAFKGQWINRRLVVLMEAIKSTVARSVTPIPAAQT